MCEKIWSVFEVWCNAFMLTDQAVSVTQGPVKNNVQLKISKPKWRIMTKVNMVIIQNFF